MEKQTQPGADDASREAMGSSAEGQLPFLTVALGASAGGLAALKAFLQAMPPDSGMAFVVIQHLDPERESLTSSLLGQQTAMPVVQVADGMPLEPNRVHVIAPGTIMTLADGTLRLRPMERTRHMSLPIDAFFSSLAEVQERRAVAIVLSGTASDGTEGTRDVKARGGLTIAQDPEQAEHEWMPRNAIAGGAVDLVLPVEKMPEALLNYQRHPYVAPGEATPEAGSEEALKAILATIAARTGHDFAGYRRSTLLRRTQRRMGFRAIKDMSAYGSYLSDHPDEVDALFGDMLIGVTKFFREPEGWEELDKLVVRPLVQRDGGGAIRVWVPACSIGKEAYTLAMLFFAASEELGRVIDLQLYATDVDTGAIAQARSGAFPLDIVQEVPPQYMARFFVGEEKLFRVVQKVRRAVVFAPQNVLADPPFSRMDLIVCRNLFIYLEPETQDRLLRLFHFSLRQGGHLFLGNSESIGPQRHLFEAVSKRWRIFQKMDAPSGAAMDLPRLLRADGVLTAAARPLGLKQEGDAGVQRLAESIVLEQYSPASVVIDRENKILYYMGTVAQFLRYPRGEPNENLLARLDDPLRGAARSLIQQVRDTGLKSSTTSSLLANGEKTPVELEILPLRGMRRGDLLLVVLRGQPPTVMPSSIEGDGGERIQELEREVAAGHEELQGVVEEAESANEELTASNEEMASMNEELQASNEELETSREELQSVNEELRTVNSELAQKVEQLEKTTDSLENLLRSTNIPTFFLDSELRLKLFTPASSNLFNFLPSDLGRPVTDLSLKLQGMDLPADALEVIKTRQPVSRPVVGADGRQYIHWTQPFRSSDSRTLGVVMTFVDVTELQRQATQLRSAAVELTVVEQRERRRLAHLLHEGLQQLLGAASMKAGSLAATASTEMKAGLEDLRAILGEAMTTSRDLTANLSPPVLHAQGLAAGFGWLVDFLRQRYQFAVEAQVAGDSEPRDEVVKVALFEAARELLFNSFKHSGKQQAKLTFERDDSRGFLLTISDDGKGFVPQQPAPDDGFGLLGVRDRVELLGGSFQVKSAPGQGTVVLVRMPDSDPKR